MWKSIVQRAVSWVKPQSSRATPQANITKEIFPLNPFEPQKCILFGSSTTNEQSSEDNGERKKRTCHENMHDRNRIFCVGSFMETFGWVGTVVLGLNLHEFCWKHQRYPLHNKDEPLEQKRNHLCGYIFHMLTPSAFAMHSVDRKLRKKVPELTVREEGEEAITPTSSEGTAQQYKEQESKDFNKIYEEIQNVTLEYFGFLENSSGVQARQKKEAFFHFKNGAKLQNCKAQFNLGICYETGHGTEINYHKAAEQYMLASKAGHMMATYNLGVYYLTGKGGLPVDEVKALELITQAAEQGVTPAQKYLGKYFTEKQDWNQAFSFLSKASLQDPEAQYYLALCYENAWGVSKSYDRAMQLYHQAASAGNPDANYALGLCYEKGKPDFERNLELAISFHQTASDAGHDTATKRVKYLKELQAYEQKQQQSQVGVFQQYKGIHAFSSVPEFKSFQKELFMTPIYQKTISHYLDIMFPNVWTKSTPRVNFWLGDTQELEDSTLANLCVQPQATNILHAA